MLVIILSPIFVFSAPDLTKNSYFIHVNERSEDVLRCVLNNLINNLFTNFDYVNFHITVIHFHIVSVLMIVIIYKYAPHAVA
jgi:hypothetical protein